VSLFGSLGLLHLGKRLESGRLVADWSRERKIDWTELKMLSVAGIEVKRIARRKYSSQ
jgi:hypothetical protein